MKNRVPLQIIDGRLILTAVIECRKLRIPKQLMEFIIDTGSVDSYISDKDVRKLQIPIKGKKDFGEVDFGGSRYKQIELPEMDIYLLIQGGHINLKLQISALKTTKISQKQKKIASMLPSILGIDFLKKNNASFQ